MEFKTIEEKCLYMRKAGLHVFREPYRLKIEASYGCNRSCNFCAVPYNIKPAKDNSHISYMTIDTFKRIIDSSPQSLRRIEFIMHGEPTCNTNLITFFKMIKEKLKHTQITLSTNGDLFIKNNPSFDALVELFNAGGNQIQLSLYDKKALENFQYLMKHESKKLTDLGVRIQDLYGQKYNDGVKNIYHYKTDSGKVLIYYDESNGLNSGDIMVRNFHSWGGAVPKSRWEKITGSKFVFDKLPKFTQCVPLLKYITFGWNGDYLLCCRDVARSVELGNIRDKSIIDFWTNDKTVNVFRVLLKHRRRDAIAPCVLCNRRGYRDGLYAYWHTDQFALEEALKVVKDRTRLKDNVLRKNLIDYLEQGRELMPHIKESIEESLRETK